jgi:ATP-dependent Clp protease ATP-binding subunit ClpA
VFERFTDRARRVLVLAQEEARLLRHPMIGSEHILLGLVGEGHGVAAAVLGEAGVDLERAREEVDRLVGRIERSYTESPPFAPRAKKALENSLRTALSMGHSYIGTEHLLLGVLEEEGTVVHRVLGALGADADDLRHRVVDALGGGSGLAGRQQREESRRLRIHVLEGLLRGIELYGEIAEAAAHCTNRAEATETLMRLPFGFSELQADNVLDLTVASVTDERRRRLAEELAVLQSEPPGGSSPG